jgi:hypothetical protein
MFGVELIAELHFVCAKILNQSGAAQGYHMQNTVRATRPSPHSLGSGVGRLRHTVERYDQSRPLGCDSMVVDSTAPID